MLVEYYARHDFPWMEQFQRAIPKRRLIKCVALGLAEAIRHQFFICKNPNFFLSHATLNHFSVGRQYIRPYLLYFQEANLIKVSFKKGRSPKITLLLLPYYNNKDEYNKINKINGTGVATTTGLKNQITKTSNQDNQGNGHNQDKGPRQGTKTSNQDNQGNGHNQDKRPKQVTKTSNQDKQPRQVTERRGLRRGLGNKEMIK